MSRTPMLSFKNGDQYFGDVRNGAPHGHGTMRYSPTDAQERLKYVGEWRRGKASGCGAMTFRDGERYEGACKDGVADGHYRWIGHTGATETGTYVKSKKCGTYVKTYPTGEKETGTYINDKKHGAYRLSNKSGDKLEGKYIDGVVCGTATYRFADGRVEKQQWKDGKLHGTAFRYSGCRTTYEIVYEHGFVKSTTSL